MTPMDQQLIDVAVALAWPLVVLISAVVLRREMSVMFARVRGIGALGDIHVVFDAAHGRVAEIIEQARHDNIPPAEVAEHILSGAIVIDKREGRILRALVDDEGRELRSYEARYRDALKALIARGYVVPAGRGYALTPQGGRVTKEYLQAVLRRMT